MADQAQRKVLIQWVRSGIGFTRRAKGMIRSLGLRRLNQIVECPDSPQVRGLVARIPHLVAVVEARAASIWPATAEYSITPPEPRPEAEPRAIAVEAEGVESETRAAAAQASEPARKHAAKQEKRTEERAAAAKGAAAKKPSKTAGGGKAKAAKAAEKKHKRPAAKPAKGKK